MVKKNVMESKIVYKEPFFKTFKKEMRRNYGSYLIALPAMIIFFLFSYLPMPGVIIAFKNYNFIEGIFGSDWSGLNNFKFFFNSPYALKTTLTVVLLNISSLVLSTTFNLFLAITAAELWSKKSVKWYQSFTFFPYVFSGMVIGQIINMVIFNDGMGVANQIAAMFSTEQQIWSANPYVWPVVVVLTKVWKGAGYGMIIYYAVVVGIDQEIYQAAAIDGATKMQRIWNITMPYLKPTIIILTLLSIGGIVYGDFEIIYAIVQDSGIKMRYTDIIETFVFRAITQSAEFSMGAAVGLYQSFVGFVLVFGSNWLVKKYEPDNALF